MMIDGIGKTVQIILPKYKCQKRKQKVRVARRVYSHIPSILRPFISQLIFFFGLVLQ